MHYLFDLPADTITVVCGRVQIFRNVARCIPQSGLGSRLSGAGPGLFTYFIVSCQGFLSGFQYHFLHHAAS